jgi:hypothetical protein
MFTTNIQIEAFCRPELSNLQALFICSCLVKVATMYKETDTAQVNGNDHTDYGSNVVHGLKQEEKAENLSIQKLSKEHDMVLKTFRLLIADLCQQFGGGHPGLVEDS